MRALVVWSLGLSPIASCAGRSSQTRMYYFAADDVDGDYSPSGHNLISGKPRNAVAKQIVLPGDGQLGHVNRKANYREYTDSTVNTLKPRPEAWQRSAVLAESPPLSSLQP